MKTIRKLMTIPAAIIGCIAGLITAEFALTGRAYWHCPAEFREGADCYLEGWTTWPDQFLAIFAALSAFLCVGLAVIVAPDHKTYWARWALVTGAIFATLAAFMTGLFFSYFIALLCGMLLYLVIRRRDNGNV
jgi:hypothetical protein